MSLDPSAELTVGAAFVVGWVMGSAWLILTIRLLLRLLDGRAGTSSTSSAGAHEEPPAGSASAIR